MSMIIRWHRIEAVIVRHWYHLTQDWIRIVQLFYWPLFDILIWGYASMWLTSGTGSLVLPYSMILGGVLWNLVVRVCFEISVNFLEEVWAHNLINLFSSPLYLTEWVCAAVLLALGMSLILGIALSGVVYLLYGLNLLLFGL